MNKPKTITCSTCEEELSGNDEIYVDNDDCAYCSKHCLLVANLDEETTAQAYIDELVECGEWDED